MCIIFIKKLVVFILGVRKIDLLVLVTFLEIVVFVDILIVIVCETIRCFRIT